ncbi:MAG TPA: aquaporin, partial [Acidimicrobiales bacterium]|nr:aquaporin [Acidimicrobiales bacterium]
MAATAVTLRDLSIEMIGTFVLVLTGTLALAQYGTAAPAAVMVVALAFGLGMAAGFSAVGPERFRWINPALTLAAALNGRIGARTLLSSVVAQVLGAIGASLVLA